MLDNNPEYAAHALRKIVLFGQEIKFVTTLDLIKCLKQIKEQIFFLRCAPIYELPSKITI